MYCSSRRTFLQLSAASVGSVILGQRFSAAAMAQRCRDSAKLFEISLAQWSLHRTLRANQLDNLDFARSARENFGIDAVEYVNQFFQDRAQDETYLNEMKTRASDLGVRSLLIMIDGEGQLGDPDNSRRTQAIENHHRWVRAARQLGCHSIRVNAASEGSFEEQQKLATDGLRRLTEYAAGFDISVIVENHGGLSSNGQWLADVIRAVGLTGCGTLPDFGNFSLGNGQWYDRYLGVEQLMPYAKAVSAKSHDFDEQGNETNTDFLRMMRIVLDAGYRGYVGIEYEGNSLDEAAGIRATKKLLERVRDQLRGEYTPTQPAVQPSGLPMCCPPPCRPRTLRHSPRRCRGR